MTTATGSPLAALYEQDETAWLDAMAALAAARRFADMDFAHLGEYLADMARRDRREVSSRLVVLLAHVLKWEYQPDQRARSWHLTILEQQNELEADVAGGVLRTHAIDDLARVYSKAIRLAAAETGLHASAFPAACPYSLDQLLAFDPAASAS